MKKNRMIKRFVSVLNKKDSYRVFQVALLTAVMVLILSVIILNQLSAYRNAASERLLGETVCRGAQSLEKMFDSAFSRLETIYDDFSGSNDLNNSNYYSNNVFDGDGFLFKSVSIQSADELLSDVEKKKDRGFIFRDGVLKMFVLSDEENVVIAELDVTAISDVATVTDTYSVQTCHILFDSTSGNIFINTANGYGFDGTVIGFLNEYSYADTYSANAMFSQIRQGLSGYTVINNKDGESFSFAYEPVMSDGWYLMQLLPKKELDSIASRNTRPFHLCIFMLCAWSLCFAVWSFFAAKRIAMDRAGDEYNGKIMKTLLMQLFENSLTSVFVFNRSANEVTVFRNREGILPKEQTYADAVTFISEYYGHSAEDSRKLKNAIALAGEKKTIKLELASITEEGEKQVEYSFCRVKNHSKNGVDKVVCTAVEHMTGEHQKVSSLSFEEQVYNTTGIEVHLERDSWRFLWNNEKCFESLNFGTEMRKSYDSDVEEHISPFIMAKDRQSFLTSLSRLNLLEKYRNGNSDFCIKYRINTGNGVYEYRILDIHMYRDGKNDEIKANFYARHIRNSQIFSNTAGGETV